VPPFQGFLFIHITQGSGRCAASALGFAITPLRGFTSAFRRISMITPELSSSICLPGRFGESPNGLGEGPCYRAGRRSVKRIMD
jgi:hypothetical protein